MGCFHVKIERILIHQVSSSEIIKTCSTVAWSLGLIYFAVHNGSECFGEKRLQSLLPRLNASSGCFGGRGGPNVSDVYRLTSKTAFFNMSSKITEVSYNLTEICRELRKKRRKDNRKASISNSSFCYDLKFTRKIHHSIALSFLPSIPDNVFGRSLTSAQRFYMFRSCMRVN